MEVVETAKYERKKLMSHYHHFTANEREKILLGIHANLSIRSIAKALYRSPSSVSRELRRNQPVYSAVDAQVAYGLRRKKSKRKLILKNNELRNLVIDLITRLNWSPEQISYRLKHEANQFSISYNTIYRAIYSNNLGIKLKNHGSRGIARKLRHRGKTRHSASHIETRGKIKISNSIHDRPEVANNRCRIGDWEADTVVGKPGHSAIVTLVDRRSRYLLTAKVPKKTSIKVIPMMIHLLSKLPNNRILTITTDRGKEFAKHAMLTDTLNVPIYFPDAHAPWQRGTNENTNGLIREYLPKRTDIDNYSQSDIQEFASILNNRPRKVLGWKTPYELFYNKVLHLI